MARGGSARVVIARGDMNSLVRWLFPGDFPSATSTPIGGHGLVSRLRQPGTVIDSARYRVSWELASGIELPLNLRGFGDRRPRRQSKRSGRRFYNALYGGGEFVCLLGPSSRGGIRGSNEVMGMSSSAAWAAATSRRRARLRCLIQSVLRRSTIRNAQRGKQAGSSRRFSPRAIASHTSVSTSSAASGRFTRTSASRRRSSRHRLCKSVKAVSPPP